MKKRRLKKQVKKVLLTTLTIIVTIANVYLLACIIKRIGDKNIEAYNYCTQTFDDAYCRKSIYGIY